MKTLGHLIQEAKATYCGRCGTTHVPPSKGGTCPALKEEVDYDRHFSRQSKLVQTKINHHLRQGADYPTAARKAGATALRVSKVNEQVVSAIRTGGRAAVRAARSPQAVAGATGATAATIDRSRPFGERDYRNLTGGSGETSATAALGQAARARLARPIPVNPTLAARAGRVGLRAAGALASKIAWPIALGMAGYDAYRGYNAQPNAPVTTRLRNMGRNVASGLTAGILISPPPGINESTTYGNGNMKTLTQFMAEANSYVETEEELSPEVRAIFDAINEAVGDRELSEEEFNQIYNYIVENLEAELEEAEELEEAHDIELKPHPNGKGTHYIVHNIHPKSGIEPGMLEKGDEISDSHVDDLHDMGYSVKIHD